ncbi:hypothetical protein [Kutzneria buriramensis]|uniref:Uncharacterized protein n=1 Tax=Kutzneria buriramensis TaxID=1045776 RepID=A0A3E0HGM2_9PSEU|nr:hypothetical protein [Kutzneria buriramensis]REH44884.1 hypothetical protein BCF44_108365 [Kutzneria buriramensis]
MRDFFDPDGPPVWHGPSELAGPTKVLVVNLAVSVLSNDIVGNDITEAVGLYLAAYARFNVWYGNGAGGGKGPAELSAIRAWSGELSKSIYDAWKNYERAFGAARHEDVEVYYVRLLAAVKSVVGEYCGIMGESIADFGDLS